jgi:hypothetical protein
VTQVFFAYLVADDECVAEADIYKCGTEKVPPIVHNMVQIAKGSPVSVFLQLIKIKFKLTYLN